MTIKTITNFIFPVGEKQLSQDAYYKALAEAESGFFPFSEDGIWHGGIHIDASFLNKIGNDDKLWCMANGEVIAYRINNVYPKIVYQDNEELIAPYQEQQKVAYFSSGFTLVRHYLKMPKIPDSTETPPAIILHSLYMHQLDWYGYQQKNICQVEYPHFWRVEAGKVNESMTDAIEGSAIRKEGEGTEVVGLLLKGSKIRLGEQKNGQSGWYKIVSITQGTLVTSSEFKTELGDTEGYVWYEDIGTTALERPTGKTADANKDYEICRENYNMVGCPEVEINGIAVYDSADDQQKLTYLPKTATFEFDGQENGYAKIKKISGCVIPSSLKVENGSQDSTHKGYVKLSSLTLTALKPEKLDEVVVLKQPIPIGKGDFIGYIGHNVSQSQRFDEPKEALLSTMKRALGNKLPKLAHIELFTCDDLPAFISKTRALADQLPESEKNIILVEKKAKLFVPTKPDGFLRAGLGIKFIDNSINYYIKINPDYTLSMPLVFFNPSKVTSQTDLNTADCIDVEQNQDEEIKNEKKRYRLTDDDKNWLINHYKNSFPELMIGDIPDEVELVNNPPVTSLIANDGIEDDALFKIQFCLEDKCYWVASKDVWHLHGQDGQLNARIDYWNNFPLSSDSIPEDDIYNTVYYPRTIPLNSIEDDDRLIARDDADPEFLWLRIIAGNKQGIPIQGWINTKKGAQEHVKRVSPWHWSGFSMIEEKASVGEFSKKVSQNHAVKLDTEDCTETMLAILRIFSQSEHNLQQLSYLPHNAKSEIENFLQLMKLKEKKPFTKEQFKGLLRTSWAAEQLGHLFVKYESEWYADEALTKWHEIDELFEEQKQQQQQNIEKLLEIRGIDKKHERNFALQKLNEAHEHVKSNWQIEKEDRIKPLLWWKEVAQAQSTQTGESNQNYPKGHKPILKNLSADGQLWYIHPVAMIDYFNIEPDIWCEPVIEAEPEPIPEPEPEEKTEPKPEPEPEPKPVPVQKSTSSCWHEPLKYPQRTYYNSGGAVKPQNGAFGLVRRRADGSRKAHTGLDLFADIGTQCFACLDGEIASLHEDPRGYGKVLVLKVKGEDLRKSRNGSSLEFKNEVMQGDDFNLNANYFYLRYCHLSKRLAHLKEGVKVKAGDLLGYTGDTGNAKGVINPHLHFEITMKPRYNRSNKKDAETNKLGCKINPALFVNLKAINKQIQKSVYDKRRKKV